MAETKGNIEETPGAAVQSTTTETPHPADETSAPGPYDGLELHRPPVSSNRPDSILAHSLVAGAGAPTDEPEYHPELGANNEDPPQAAFVNADDREAGLVQKAPPAPKGSK